MTEAVSYQIRKPVRSHSESPLGVFVDREKIRGSSSGYFGIRINHEDAVCSVSPPLRCPWNIQPTSRRAVVGEAKLYLWPVSFESKRAADLLPCFTIRRGLMKVIVSGHHTGFIPW